MFKSLKSIFTINFTYITVIIFYKTTAEFTTSSDDIRTIMTSFLASTLIIIPSPIIKPANFCTTYKKNPNYFCYHQP